MAAKTVEFPRSQVCIDIFQMVNRNAPISLTLDRLANAIAIYDKLGELIEKILVEGYSIPILRVNRAFRLTSTDSDARCFSWSPDGEYLAAAQTDSSRLISWESAARKKTFVQPDVKMALVDFVCWSPDTSMVRLRILES